MEGGVNALALCCAGVCGTEPPAAVCSGQVCSSKKVSDHHAVVPTHGSGRNGLEALPAGEREILRLVSRQVLMAVSATFVYLETEVKLDCGGNAFAAKGKTILNMGWRVYTEKGKQDNTLPGAFRGTVASPFPPARSKRAERPRPNTSLRIRCCRPWRRRAKRICRKLRSGAGWEPPATRAAVIEKLVATGFAERRKAKKNLYVSFPPKWAFPSLPCCPNSSSPRCSPPNGSTASRRSSAASWARTSSLPASAIWSQCWFGTLRLWTARRCCSPSGRPVVGKCPPLRRRGHGEQKRLFLRDGAASSGCGGTTASLPPRRSA